MNNPIENIKITGKRKNNMKITSNRYMVNKSLKYNRLAFDVLEININTINYTRIKVYVFVPFLHLPNVPTKIIDFIILKENEQ